MKAFTLLLIGIAGCLCLATGFGLMFAGPTAGADFEIHKTIVLSLMVSGFALLWLSGFSLRSKRLLIGQRIIKALATGLPRGDERSHAISIVNQTITQHGETNRRLVEYIFDALHADMRVPSRAIALIRQELRKGSIIYA